METLLTLVEIQLGRDHYLIDSDIVDKFILPLQPTSVYDAPPYIEGMVRWNDDTIPAIDVAPLLGMTRAIGAERRRTMIIAAGKVADTAMAVSVDGVEQIRKISPADIAPVDISTCHGIQDYVKGIVRLQNGGDEGGEQLVLLYLNIEKMVRELLKGKISRPVPDFYVWRWDSISGNSQEK
jgi:chemotaxis signal transduction protein